MIREFLNQIGLRDAFEQKQAQTLMTETFEIEQAITLSLRK
jgi:hypothetical protein